MWRTTTGSAGGASGTRIPLNLFPATISAVRVAESFSKGRHCVPCTSQVLARAHRAREGEGTVRIPLLIVQIGKRKTKTIAKFHKSL